MEFYETHQEFKAFECFQCNVFSADTHANEESSADILTNENDEWWRRFIFCRKQCHGCYWSSEI